MPAATIDTPSGIAARAGDVSDRRIHHEVVVPAPPAEVFRLWTTEGGMASWWIDTCSIRLEIGGHFELYFLVDAPPGSRGSEGCRILSFVPDRMLSFTWNAPPHLDRTRSRYTWVVLELEPVDDGTRVSLTHLGWPARGWNAEPQWPETFAYFDSAWERVLALLAEHCGAQAPG